jgi:hypothetical protein
MRAVTTTILCWLGTRFSRLERPSWRTAAVVVLGALVLWRFWHLRAAGNWDFRVYYWAAKAQSLGLDPYSLDDLSRVAGEKVVLRYLYPPTILYLVRPLAWLPLPTAISVYVGLKVACIAGLVLIWRACLGRRETIVLFVLVILGFSDSVFNDVFAGNIGTFEATALWLAFFCLLHRRLLGFAVLVLLASIAKMTPVAFLLLVLLTNHRRRIPVFVVATIIGGLVPILSFGGRWSRLSSYLRMLAAVDERGPTNSAILPLLKDVQQHLARAGMALSFSPMAVYVAICVVVVLLTVVAMGRTMRNGEPDRDALLERVMGLVIVYALLLPRFKDYSYCLLLPAVVFVGRRIRNALPLLVFVAALTTRNTLARYALGDFPVAEIVWRYFNLAVTGILWLAFLTYLWERGRPQPRAM